MDILLTGNIFIATDTLTDKLKDFGKIILCGDGPAVEYKNKKVVSYKYREDDNEFRGVFKSYNLDTVVYFAKVLDGQKRLYDEIEMLENVLYCSRLSGVKKIIYVTTNDYVEGMGTTRTRLINACDDICRQFADKNNIDLTLLRVPYLYAVEETESNLNKMLNKAMEDKIIEIPGAGEHVTDFLSDEDLGELLARIIDEPQRGYCEANISGGNKMEMSTLAEYIHRECPADEIVYRGFEEAVPQYVDDGIMREKYGWFAVRSLEESLPDIVATILKNKKTERKQKVVSARKKKITNFILVTLEMAFVFIISELLTNYTKNFYRMDYVDFRLLFVVIMGTIHGTGAGIIASVLACLGYFSDDLLNSNFQIIFYNIENWLPFAAYFLSGTMVGHVRDKNKESIRFLNEQQQILENKYIFLNELYGKTLENKEDFSRQILGYEDSFGKIYQVVRKLNSTVTDKIFYESVNAMESILDVSSVAIYAINENSPFARLNVCSSESNESLAKTINLELYPKVWEALKNNQSWYNAERIGEHPIYVAPINRGGKLIGMIALWKVSADQMKMDYYNRFNIMCGLVQDALVRAIEYNENQEHEHMIEGTRFLKPEYFEDIVEMKAQLGKDGMYEYVLMQIEAKNLTDVQLSDAVSAGIRNTDVLGMRDDGKYYLLLNQASEESVRIVKKRLEPQGIILKRV